MTLDILHYSLAAVSGGLVGLFLGVFGGGGSILAVPLMVYVVGVPNAHVAIGTSAFAVAANAFTNLLTHSKLGTIKWRCAGIYSVAGVGGAFLGSSLGKSVDGQKLLFLFALLMLLVGLMTFRKRGHTGDPGAQCTTKNAPKVVGLGTLTGTLSGFFGIGGGFLIVPGLMASTGMPVVNAIGSSLVAITAFGFTTAVNYAFSGLVDWLLAAVFVLGGSVGGIAGAFLARYLATRKGTLMVAFSVVIFSISLYMMYQSASSLVS